MKTAGVTVYVGTPRSEWCDDCLTSDVVVADLSVLNESGVWHVGTFRKCQRCDRDGA